MHVLQSINMNKQGHNLEDFASMLTPLYFLEPQLCLSLHLKNVIIAPFQTTPGWHCLRLHLTSCFNELTVIVKFTVTLRTYAYSTHVSVWKGL